MIAATTPAIARTLSAADRTRAADAPGSVTRRARSPAGAMCIDRTMIPFANAEPGDAPRIDRALEPDFPKEATTQLATIDAPANENSSAIGDLRKLLWCSIDNDDSRDL